MDDPVVLQLTVQGMFLVLILSMPAILLATIAGLFISIIQALTQIQEQTLGFAIKLIVVIITLLFSANYLAAELYNYTAYIFEQLPLLAR